MRAVEHEGLQGKREGVSQKTTFVCRVRSAFNLVEPDVQFSTGLAEVNTFFMIARRCWQSQRELMHQLYWFSFVPLRSASYLHLAGNVIWRAC